MPMVCILFYGMHPISNTDIRNKLGESSSQDSLRSCLPLISNLNHIACKHYNDLNAFEKQKCTDMLAELRKLYSAKEKMLNKTTFQFIGDPIPPSSIETTSLKLRHEIEVKPQLHGLRLRKHIISTNLPHMLISDIQESILSNWKQDPIRSIHLQDIDSSILHLVSNGPVIVERARNSVLIIDCHQLRLHEVVNCTIVVNVSNDRIVIETCNNLKIVPQKEKLLTIDDFSWPTLGEVNPHYTISDAQDYAWIEEIQEGALNSAQLTQVKKAAETREGSDPSG